MYECLFQNIPKFISGISIGNIWRFVGIARVSVFVFFSATMCAGKFAAEGQLRLQLAPFL
jgi:hypothetical protein